MPRRRTLPGVGIITGTWVMFLKLPFGPHCPHSVPQNMDKCRDISLSLY